MDMFIVKSLPSVPPAAVLPHSPEQKDEPALFCPPSQGATACFPTQVIHAFICAVSITGQVGDAV